MAWKGVDDDSGIYHTSFDGGWAAQDQVPGVGCSEGPALAVFNGRLHMAWKGVDDDSGIYHTSFDGGWAAQDQVPGVGGSEGPALAMR
jgi:hypothetical protein